MINWGNRLRNKHFISAMISMALLAIKNFTGIELPYEIDLIVDLVLTSITTLGIVIDPNSEGFSDIQEKEEVEETFECMLDVLNILCKKGK